MRLGIVGGCAVSAWALVSAMGCSSDPASTSTDIGSTQSAIQNGAIDTTHTYAVGIAIGGKGPALQAICSGALIAPNLVVTARHCVDNISSAQVDCATATFGGLMYSAGNFWVTTSSNMLQSTQGWHQVSKVVTPTPTAVCGNDLALLILTANVSASEATPIIPAVQYPITDHTRYSTTDTAIGYGVTTPTDQNGQTAGTRHIKQNINIQCIPGDKQLDCGSLAGQNIDVKEFVSGDGTCEGDSGSSAYEQMSFNAGSPVSLGVLSRGGVSNDGTTCIGSVYTRLDSWKDLIISTAQAAATQGGYPLPAWAGGTVTPPDAGVSDDAGSSTPDAGANTGPEPGATGASCTGDSDCTSNVCRSYKADTSICTQSCDAQNTCPDGYACANGFCFPKSSVGNQVTTTTTTSGCAVAPGSVGSADPNKPVPWRALGAGLGLVALAAMRRRRRSA